MAVIAEVAHWARADEGGVHLPETHGQASPQRVLLTVEAELE